MSLCVCSNFTWEAQNPVSFQSWTNYNYGQRNITSFEERVYVSYNDYILLKDSNDIERVKYYSTSTIYPLLDHCTLLLVSNLAYPQWVSVDCYKPILHHIICALKETGGALRNKEENPDILSCSNMTVKHNNTCYKFKWFNNTTESNQSFYEKCKIHKMTPVSITNLHNFNFILEATSIVSFKVLSELSINLVTIFSFDKLWFQIKYANQIIDKKFASGFYICHGKTEHIKFDLQNLYKCSNNTFISVLHVCDRSNDCDISKGDEIECRCKGFNKYCRKICNEQSCSCSPLYFKSHNSKCLRYTFQKLKNHNTTKHNWNYKWNKSSEFTYTTLLDDLSPDHGNNSEDETMLQNILQRKTPANCKVPGELPCQGDHSKCYGLHYICIYRLDEFSHLIPCRTGSHIEECEAFQCNQMFKCPEYYCIPWGYVCDGKWDCPHGYDEFNKFLCHTTRKCENMFRCKHSQICTAISDICNGILDCPYGDDEILCEIKNTVCPKLCVCLHFALMCSAITNRFLKFSDLPFVAYHLTSCSLRAIEFLKYNKFAAVLNLADNKIGDSCNSLSHIYALTSVDISKNCIMIISKGCFSNLYHLSTINLQVNKLSLIESKSFQNLGKIKLIDMSNNKLLFLFRNTFYNVVNIDILKLQNNLFTDIKFNMFSTVPVKVIITDDFHICCISPKGTQCIETPPWYISCSNLLPNMKVRFLFSIISFIILAGNSLCFLKNITIIMKRHKGELYSIIICATNAGDSLWGGYLCIVWVGDLQYGREFIVNEMKWRNGVLCSLAFMFILMFSLVMPYLLSLLSFARYMVVVYPMESKFRSARFVCNSVCAGAGFSLLITFLFVIYLKFKQIIPTYLCSPFIDPSNSIAEIKFVTIGVAVLQMLTFCFIIIIYFQLLRFVLKLKQEMLVESKLMSRGLVMQILLVTASNLAGWFPSSLIFLISLLKSKYPVDLLIWTTIAVMPINSIINPLIFISHSRTKSSKDKSSMMSSVKTSSLLKL